MTDDSRVQFLGNGVIGISLDWAVLVSEPAAKNDYQSAFASADALIDRLIGVIFREIYRRPESQDIIDWIEKERDQSRAILKALKEKRNGFEKIEERIKSFKKERNIVIHNVEAHYKLVRVDDLRKVTDKAMYDSIAKQTANKSLAEAFAIFNDLVEKLREIKLSL